MKTQLGLFLAAVLVAGCASYGVIGGDCARDDDCPPGTSCVNDTCTTAPPNDGGTSCGDSLDCPTGQQCVDNACVPTDPPDGGGGGGPDGGTGGGSDGGTGGGSDGGSGGGSDGGTGGGSDGGTGGCTSDEQCPPGTVCRDNVCVCDGDPPVGACGTNKTQLCHYPPGNPGNLHEICVGNAAVTAHLAHGDTLGSCP